MVRIDPTEKLALLQPGAGVGPWCVVKRHARGAYGTVYCVLPYIVMEWVEGVPLYEWAQGRKLTSRDVLRVLGHVARALEATHAAGCVHRDVKGDNVLVRAEEGTAVLMDFGAGDFHGAHTLTGTLLPPGTPRYRSPEALRFEWEHQRDFRAHYEPGPADDVYALGVTAYRLATGTYPLPRRQPGQREEEDRYIAPVLVPPEELANLSPALTALIRQMLADEPSARGSAAQVAQEIERAARAPGPGAEVPITPDLSRMLTVKTEHPGPPPPRRSLAGLIWLGVVVAVMLSVLVAPQDGGKPQPQEEPLIEVTQEASDGGRWDGGSAGLVEGTFTSMRAASPVPVRGSIGLNMPKTPLPGQRRPPCNKPEIELNGGCWVILGNATPPCGPRSYEWKNGCYWASYDPPLPSTSEPP